MRPILSSNIRTWSRLGQIGTFYGVALLELGSEYKNLRLLTADLAVPSGMTRFQSAYPEQFLNVGIAEQNMIGIAAGLALEGNCVFTNSYAAFIAVRSLEHVRQHLAHLQCNIKVVGFSAGVMAARSGIAHWATEDIAFMRALPNITVFSPSDCLDAYKIAHYAAETEGPMYIRLSGGPNAPIVHKEDYNFEAGKMERLQKGSDVCIFATGLMVKEALDAAGMLQEKGIACTVYNVHTIKPLDLEALEQSRQSHRLLVSLEEHNIIGGLGGAVAEYLSSRNGSPRLIRMGIPDAYSAAGSQRWIWEQNGIDSAGVARKIEEELI